MPPSRPPDQHPSTNFRSAALDPLGRWPLTDSCSPTGTPPKNAADCGVISALMAQHHVEDGRQLPGLTPVTVPPQPSDERILLRRYNLGGSGRSQRAGGMYVSTTGPRDGYARYGMRSVVPDSLRTSGSERSPHVAAGQHGPENGAHGSTQPRCEMQRCIGSPWGNSTPIAGVCDGAGSSRLPHAADRARGTVTRA